jgi:flavin-dependent dehydrogenase
MRASLRCDVVVIGGGPAGTATALALQARGIQALVAEKSHYESSYPGETLLGDAQPFLLSLRVWDRFVAGRSAQAAPVLSCWGDAEARPRPPELSPHGAGWHIDRKWFDRMLADAAEDAGALVYCGVRPDRLERSGSVWRMALRGDQGREAEVQPRYIVDATGRAAWVARRLGSGMQRVDRLIGIVARYADAPAGAALLVESAPEGWWYSVPRPGGGTVAVYLTDIDLVSKQARRALFDAALEETTHTRARLRNLGKPALHVVAAHTSEHTCSAGEGWLAAGDAAFALDPLSGSGIRRALESGIRVAETISASLHGIQHPELRYNLHARQQFAQQLRARSHFYGRERRWPHSAFWQRRYRPSA